MIFARQIHSFALATGLSTLFARSRRAYRIIMFHGVGDAHMPAAAFEANLRWMAERFRVVPLTEIVQGIAEGRTPGGRGEVALTFDDGLGNHFEQAWPVLRQLGLPASFFICPDLIDGRRWLWNHEARARLRRMTPAARGEFAQAELGVSTDAIEPLVQRMKDLALVDRERAEAALRACTPEFVPTPQERDDYDPLSWEQVRALDPSLITIGSHTLSHPILPTISDDALEREVDASRRVLEERLDRSVDLFCYPNGSLDDRVYAHVSRSYRAAVTTNYGLAQPCGDLHRLMRIPAAADLPLMAWRMSRPKA